MTRHVGSEEDRLESQRSAGDGCWGVGKIGGVKTGKDGGREE